MSDDFSKPQPYNVPYEPELADTTGGRSMPIIDAPYEIPSVVHIVSDDNLYPPVRHGVRGPRLRRR